MRRPFAALVILVLLAGCNAKDEPDPTSEGSSIPPGPPPPPPPPTPGSVVLHANDTWRYRGGTIDAPEDIIVVITSVANGTVHMRSVNTYGANQTHVVESRLVEETLALAASFDDALGFEIEFDPPLPVLIPAADHEYVGNITVPTPLGEFAQPAFATIRFIGLENVTVPAGAFETYRYHATLVSTGIREFRQESEIWFSPVARQAVKSVTDGRLQELVSYSVG